MNVINILFHLRKKEFKMAEMIVGKILTKSVKHDYGKTFFYVLDGKNKVLVVLNEGVELPENLEGTFEITGEFSYSYKNRILKLKASALQLRDEKIDYREELRQMMANLRGNAS